MAVPAWVERLRQGVFVSPSGVESTFRSDTASRTGGKKASIHEILNSNDAIPQDQGNRSRLYPLQAYFTGDNGDIEADAFFDSLHEKYTIASPGMFKSQRWGDIPVMPFEISQVENLVSEGGIFRVTVQFREVPASLFPTVGVVDQSEVVAQIDELETTLEEANQQIDAEKPSRYAEFRSKIQGVIESVNDAIGEVAARVDDIQDEFESIQNDINAALAAGASVVEIMSQVNNLIRLPGQIIDTTISKVRGYAQLVEDISASFIGFFNPNADRQTELNNGIMFQSLTAIASAATTEAALFTEYDTREMASDALDFINLSADVSAQGASEIQQTLSNGITGTFAPDHNTGLELTLLTGNTNAILIERSFDLKTKQTLILTAPSDALTLTWYFHKDLSKLDSFIKTNNLQDVEIIELPAGKEVFAYV